MDADEASMKIWKTPASRDNIRAWLNSLPDSITRATGASFNF